MVETYFDWIDDMNASKLKKLLKYDEMIVK